MERRASRPDAGCGRHGNDAARDGRGRGRRRFDNNGPSTQRPVEALAGRGPPDGGTGPAEHEESMVPAGRPRADEIEEREVTDERHGAGGMTGGASRATRIARSLGVALSLRTVRTLRTVRALAVALAVGAAPLLPAAPAAAQDALSGGASWAEAPRWPDDVARWLGNLGDRTSTAQCLGALARARGGTVPTLTVLGVPLGEPGLEPGVRRAINETLLQAVPARYSSRDAAIYAEMIESVMPQRGVGSTQGALRDIYGSDMFVLAEVERRAPTAIQLKISLSILDPETGALCETDRYSDRYGDEISLDVASLRRVAPPPLTAERYYDVAGALGAAIPAVLRDLNGRAAAGDGTGDGTNGSGGTGGAALAYAIEGPFAAPLCPLPEFVEGRLSRAYADARDNDAINRAIGISSFPPLRRVDDPAAADLVIGLGPAPDTSAHAGGVPVMALTLGAPGRTASSYTAVVPPALAERFAQLCAGTAAMPLEAFVESGSERRHALALSPLRPRLAPGDDLEVRIAPGEDLFLYCWILNDDGTARPAYPSRDFHGKAPFPRGATYVYPTDFGLRIPVAEPGRSLFGCFTTPSPVDEALRADWIGAANAPSNLTFREVRDYLARFRALRTVGESYAWIDHRGPDAPGPVDASFGNRERGTVEMPPSAAPRPGAPSAPAAALAAPAPSLPEPPLVAPLPTMRPGAPNRLQ